MPAPEPIPIPGTRLLLAIKDEKLDTPEVRAWLEACANALAPEAQAIETKLSAGTLGVVGQRDPGAPCTAYLPGKPGAGDCESDGHYLCYTDPGCVRYKAPPPECPKDCAALCTGLALKPCPDGKGLLR